MERRLLRIEMNLLRGCTGVTIMRKDMARVFIRISLKAKQLHCSSIHGMEHCAEVFVMRRSIHRHFSTAVVPNSSSYISMTFAGQHCRISIDLKPMSLPHFVQQCREHLGEIRMYLVHKDVPIGIQLDQALPVGFPDRGQCKQTSQRGTVLFPCQADIPSKLAAEKDLVEITESLDS